MSILPPNILRCLRPEDRKSLGKAGLLPEEALAKMEIKGERDLQKQIVGLLRIKGIEPLVPTFGKKTRLTTGWPDITFSVNGEACVFEIKLPGQKLSTEQAQLAIRLMSAPNGWLHATIYSMDDAIDFLKGRGLE